MHWQRLHGHDENADERRVAHVPPDHIREDAELKGRQPDVVQVHKDRIEARHVVRQQVDDVATLALVPRQRGVRQLQHLRAYIINIRVGLKYGRRARERLYLDRGGILSKERRERESARFFSSFVVVAVGIGGEENEGDARRRGITAIV